MQTRRAWLARAVATAGAGLIARTGVATPSLERAADVLAARARALALPAAVVGWCRPRDRQQLVRWSWPAMAGAPVLDERMSWPVGSAGKLLLGSLVLEQLAARGVEPEALVAPWVAEPWSSIVPRETDWTSLAHHRAGLPEPMRDPTLHRAITANPTRRWHPDELAAIASRMPRSPGPVRTWRYSNLHSMALAHAVERLTGAPLTTLVDAWCRDRLATPAGSWQHPASLDWRARGLTAWRHAPPDRPLGYGTVLTDVTAYNPSWSGAGGDWSATLEGLVALGSTLTHATSPLVGASRWIADVPRPGQAYGFHLIRRGAWLGHGGDVPGFSAACWARPADGSVVAAMVPLSNTAAGESPAEALATQVIDLQDAPR
jgi:D-alanyl-D-alanine carboxypeptidase